MSQALPFTKAKLRKAIQVAKENGCRVVVRPDGELVIEADNNPQPQQKAVEDQRVVVL